LAAAALAAGRPQVLAPRHGEASATARLLEGLGVGISVAQVDRASLREAIERVQDGASFAAAAQRAGEVAQTFLDSANGLSRTIAALTAL
jgi:UDP:flavonoid glycosyltransferase YjiC (YdhE family)